MIFKPLVTSFLSPQVNFIVRYSTLNYGKDTVKNLSNKLSLAHYAFTIHTNNELKNNSHWEFRYSLVDRLLGKHLYTEKSSTNILFTKLYAMTLKKMLPLKSFLDITRFFLSTFSRNSTVFYNHGYGCFDNFRNRFLL